MRQLILTGSPGCNLCVLLERVVSKITTNFTKVNVQENEEILALVKADGNTTPATLLFGKHRYVVSQKTPAKVPAIKAWLEEVGFTND